MQNSTAALITGASAGIGATYADRLARRGHDLILVARDQTRLATLADRLHADTGRNIEVLPADLSARSGVEGVEQRLRQDPRIGLLVNNAGIAIAGPMLGSDPDRLEAMVQLNVVATLRLAHAAVAGFVARGSGTLINIASVLALMPELFNATYSGTKAFMLNLSLALHTETAGKGVRIQAVLPGATRTELWGKAGIDVAAMRSETVMDVEEMVDAALVGLDHGEIVTIPSLPDPDDWATFEAARKALAPNLSRQHAAERYASRPAG
jgi:uncharacterized protein